MKTQRRRERADRLTRPAPGPDAIEEDGADDGAGLDSVADADGVAAESTPTSHNGPETPQQRALPPTLPRRRRRVQSVARPAGIVAESPPPPAVERDKRPSERAIAPAARAVAPPAPAPSDQPPWRLWLTYENLFWFGIFLVAIVTRFWDIGNRGIHHDESLHAVYSRNLYIGTGYTHDPMMHGPLQFHFIALMYWLFGATDATARFASAFSGLIVVMSPFFLRQQMGRLTALIASFLLLVSPSILYFSRMAREDAIFSGMEMIMIVGLWRFITTRKPADFYVLCAGLALMLTIKETAYLSIAVLAVFFVLLFAIQSGYAILAALGGYLVAAGGIFLALRNNTPPLPNIPEVGPNYDRIMTFVTQLIQHPLVIAMSAITLLFLAALVGLFITQRRRMLAGETPSARHVVRRRPSSALPTRRVARPVITEEVEPSGNGRADAVLEESSVEDAPVVAGDATADDVEEVWNPSRLEPKRDSFLGRYEPGSMPHLIGALFSRPKVIVIGLLIAATIFVVLYTVFFTDIPRGIVSGLFASVGYWMAQHDVKRGGQPWFYYFLLIPLYEPIAAFFTVVGGAFFSWRGVRWLFRRKRYEDLYADEPRNLSWFNPDRYVPFASFNAFLPLFLGWWLVGVTFIYSWAGEKMPWLMVHMVRPAIFLAAIFIGALVASVIRRRRERIEEAMLYEEELYNLPTRRARTAPRGALFSLKGAEEAAQRAGIAPRRLALQGGALSNSTVAFSAGRGPRASAVPSRRRTAREEEVYYRAVQEPPWVGWNRAGSRFPSIFFLVAFTVLVLAWGLKMNALTFHNRYEDWGLTWIFPIMILGMVLFYAVWLGPGRALRYLALGILAVGLLYQFRSAIMLTYHQPDVPKEMAVYVQTSPDTTRVMREMETYANYAAGGKRNLRVMYDSFTSWPMEWYLRDYNKHFIGGDKARPDADHTILLLEYARHNTDALANDIRNLENQIADLEAQPASPERDSQIQSLRQQMETPQNVLNNYVQQRYAMRWWFPEEWYKSEFLPGMNTESTPFNEQVGQALRTTWLTVAEPRLQATLWKYLVFRETPKPLGSEDMVVLLRRDIMQQYHYLQYPPPPSTDVP